MASDSVSADLIHLADLIRQRNSAEVGITRIIGRPAQIGHSGEYVASKVFNISLAGSASQRGIDGCFVGGALQGRTVNIKWYAKNEGLLDVASITPPDYYLVFTGTRVAPGPSRRMSRPWLISAVFLFDGPTTMTALKKRGIGIGVATSVVRTMWDAAEIYPNQRNQRLLLSDQQRRMLALFG